MRAVYLSLSLLAFAVPAIADLDVQVRNGDHIRGTVFPAAEVETYRVELPRGAVLSVVGRPKKTRDRRFPPRLSLRLLDPTEHDATADLVRTHGNRTSLTGFRAPATGTYAIEVRGDGFDIGDYLLTVRWKMPRRIREKGVTVGATATDVATLVADADSVLQIRTKASKHSAVLPRVVEVARLLPQGGDEVVRAYVPPTRLAKRHNVEATLRTTGEFVVRAADGLGGEGPIDVDVRVHPIVAKRSVRLTDDRVGSVPAGVDIVSTVLFDDSGGTTVGDGARVVVPQGGVVHLTPVRVGVGPSFDGPPGTGLLPAGPGVFVGPESLEFDRLASVVVPYDSAAFDGDLTQLRIVRRDAAGLRTVLDAGAVVVDAGASTASIPIGRGGTYAAFRRVPPPAPTSITPFAGDTAGGYVVTLGGSGFRDLRDPVTGASLLAILLDGVEVGVEITDVSSTLLTFTAPAHAAGRVTFGVRDPETGLVGTLPTATFLYQ